MQDLIDAGHRLWKQGLLPATSGNLSVLDPESGMVTVTRSGCDKGFLRDANFATVPRDARARDFVGVSAETDLHLAVYRTIPASEAGCVIHTHGRASTLRSTRTGILACLTGWELLKALAPVQRDGRDPLLIHACLPVFLNDQNIEALAGTVESYYAATRETESRTLFAPGFLLNGHGMYVWGRDVAEAVRHTEALEYLLDLPAYEDRQR